MLPRNMSSDPAPEVASRAVVPDRFFDQSVRVAVWSVALGIGLEIAHLVLLAFQDRLPDAARIVAETMGKVTWSVFVCLSISFGMAAGKARPRAMALLGLLSAPAGFAIARSVHKGVASALSVAPGATEVLSPFLMAGIKAIEYGVLGLVVARLSSRPKITLKGHLLAGLAIGVVAALLLNLLALRAQPDMPTTVIVGRTVAEVLFPVGCSAVIYVTERAMRVARGRA